MAESLTVYPGAYGNNKYFTLSNGTNPVGKGSDNTTYAIMTAAQGNTSYIRWPFDLSAIPDGAEIDSIVCKAKIQFAYQVSSVTAKIQLATGDVLKGSSVSLPQNPKNGNVLTVTDAGTWTRDELQSCNLYIEATATSSSSTVSRQMYFYGADLTVVYTYQSEKFMLKLEGAYADIARVFQKIDGIWIEQNDLNNVVVSENGLINGGEIQSTVKKATVTITGDKNDDYAYVAIDGTKYHPPTSVVVELGTIVEIYTHYYYGLGKGVTLNGTKVSSSGSYYYEVTGDCAIAVNIDPDIIVEITTT